MKPTRLQQGSFRSFRMSRKAGKKPHKVGPGNQWKRKNLQYQGKAFGRGQKAQHKKYGKNSQPGRKKERRYTIPGDRS